MPTGFDLRVDEAAVPAMSPRPTPAFGRTSESWSRENRIATPVCVHFSVARII
jgi:hypothetical protein